MPDIPVSAPLTEEHLSQIINGLDIIKIAQQQIDKAKRAGIDVSQHEKDLADHKSKLLQIKNVYFPGR